MLDERGDAMVMWCLLLALMLLPLGGLSVDLWHGIAVQRALQSAAEDAATAGASGISVSQYRDTGCLVLDPGVAVPLAQANLASQTDLGPLAGADISVAPGGQSISVTLREDVHLTLLSLVEGDKPLVVTASATSAPRGSVPESGCQ
jgi:Flp pilus assembly protein TadG